MCHQPCVPQRVSRGPLSPDPVFRVLASPQCYIRWDSVLHFIDVFRLFWSEKSKHKHSADKSGSRSGFWSLNWPSRLLGNNILAAAASCLYDIWSQTFCVCLTLYEFIFETCDDYGKQSNFLVKLTLVLFVIEFAILFACISSL